MVASSTEKTSKYFKGKLLVGLSLLLLVAVGCSNSGGNAVQPTISSSAKTEERPAMQTNASGAQIDRGVKKDIGSESRRSPPQ